MLFSHSGLAANLNLEYASFYSHLKKIDDEKLDKLQFSFGFVHAGEKRLCAITHVEIVTQKQTIEVNVNAYNRFTLPIEKALKLANAVVALTLDDNPNQCDISVQLETKDAFLKTHYNTQELLSLNQQFSQFFDDMGGMFSFLMPSSAGLNFVFENTPDVTNVELSKQIKNNELHLPNSTLKVMSNGLNLATKPLRITALVKQ